MKNLFGRQVIFPKFSPPQIGQCLHLRPLIKFLLQLIGMLSPSGLPFSGPNEKHHDEQRKYTSELQGPNSAGSVLNETMTHLQG